MCQTDWRWCISTKGFIFTKKESLGGRLCVRRKGFLSIILLNLNSSWFFYVNVKFQLRCGFWNTFIVNFCSAKSDFTDQTATICKRKIYRFSVFFQSGICKVFQNISGNCRGESWKIVAFNLHDLLLRSTHASPVSLVLTCCSMCFQRHMRPSFINDKNSGELALEKKIYNNDWGVTAGLGPHLNNKLASKRCASWPATVPLALTIEKSIKSI